MKSHSTTVIAIVFAGVLIGGAILLSSNQNLGTLSKGGNNVSMVDGKQIIEIDAKGGYLPKIMQGQAGIPTVLRIATDGTFDCSASLIIPAIGYQKTLPPRGTTDIEIPPQKSGTTLQGLCAMGMYNFQVQFN